jgi:hypothetical protein
MVREKGNLRTPASNTTTAKIKRARLYRLLARSRWSARVPTEGLAQSPGFAKDVQAINGSLPCSCCSDERTRGLTLPVLLRVVEEQRITEPRPQESHVDDQAGRRQG